jgi:hypothetical protein
VGVAAAAIVSGIAWLGMQTGGGGVPADDRSKTATESTSNAPAAPAGVAPADPPRALPGSTPATETTTPFPDSKAGHGSAPRAASPGGVHAPLAMEAKPSSATPTPTTAPARGAEASATAAFPLATAKAPGAAQKPLGALPPPPTPTERARKRPLDNNPFAQ